MTFKNGDTVVIKNGRGNYSYNGHEAVVERANQTSEGEFYSMVKSLSTGATAGVYNVDLTLVNNKKNMSLIEKAKLVFKKEPEKSFIKAGVLDSSENLTTDGKDLLLTYLLEKNKEDFKATIVDPILTEEETKNN